MNHSKIWAIIPAAGVGQRMQAELPKQYLPLNHQCILQITLDKIATLPEVAGVVVAIAPNDTYFANTVNVNTNATVVFGASQRSGSVRLGLRELLNKGCEDDWVLVHDAARPCVRTVKIRELIQQVVAANRGGILAVPVADTLKRVDDLSVVATVDRDHLWQAHTPQMFRVGELYQALEKAHNDQVAITDEASAMEYVGYRPLIVADSRDNIKITQPEDLAFAQWILSAEPVDKE